MILRERQFMLFGLSPDRTNARGLWLLLAVWLGTIIFAGAVAPVVYFVTQSLAEGNPDGLAASLIERPFDKFVDRCRYVPVVLLLPWLMAQVGLMGKGFVGANDLRPTPAAGLWLVYSLVLGSALAALIAALQLIFTWYWPADTGPGLPLIGQAAVSALLIALIEEIVFRSLIFRLFFTAMHPVGAIFASSLVYAWLHFSAPADLLAAASEHPGFLAGIQVAFLNAFGPVLNFDALTFANYAALGALLAVLYLRARTLWAPVGLHAGIVFIMLVYQDSFYLFPDPLRWVFAGGGLSDGVVPLILTLALTLIFAVRLPVSRS